MSSACADIGKASWVYHLAEEHEEVSHCSFCNDCLRTSTAQTFWCHLGSCCRTSPHIINFKHLRALLFLSLWFQHLQGLIWHLFFFFSIPGRTPVELRCPANYPKVFTVKPSSPTCSNWILWWTFTVIWKRTTSKAEGWSNTWLGLSSVWHHKELVLQIEVRFYAFCAYRNLKVERKCLWYWRITSLGLQIWLLRRTVHTVFRAWLKLALLPAHCSVYPIMLKPNASNGSLRLVH